MSLIPPQGNSIVNASQEAVTALSALSDNDHNPLGSRHHQTTAYKPSDERERLEIWICEHEVRFGKLDYKLREASHLRDRVLSLLAELTSTTHGSSCLDKHRPR
jgi:hypothetical protein